MTEGRRKGLAAPGPTTDHPGLILDRYLEQTGDKHESAKRLYDIACASKPGDLYRAAFARWETMLSGLGARCEVFTTRTRLIVGLGSESVRETGITLHHTYGYPIIPGSALKGLLARYLARGIPCLTSWSRDADSEMSGLTKAERDVLTGTPGAASFVTFFDAWYVARPGDSAGSPFRNDVITVHHPVYYSSRGLTRAPWDFDDPTPVPFVSAAGDYLIAVSCPGGADWEAIAMTLLTAALRDWGIGGKTSSGYGRMEPANDAASTTTTPAPPNPKSETDLPTAPFSDNSSLSPEAAELLAEVRTLSNEGVEEFLLDWLVEQWRGLVSDVERRIVANALIGVLSQAGLIRAWASKPSVVTLVAAASGTTS